jgi:hypothetical protein
MRPIKLQDRILYTQIMTAADYVVHALTSVDFLRGGVQLRGSFERHGETVDRITVQLHQDAVTVGETQYSAIVYPNGLFLLSPIV